MSLFTLEITSRCETTAKDVLIGYNPFYIVSTYDIKYFNRDLMSLITPGFSVLLCHHS